MKYKIILIVMVIGFSLNLNSQIIESEILEKGGIKSMSLANANSAKSGETEFFTESPASPADLEVPTLSLSYGDIAGFNNFLNASFSYPTLRGVISGNIKYFSADQQNSGLNSGFGLAANFSKIFTDKLFVGLGLKFLSADYFDKSGSAIGVNLGGIYHIWEYNKNRQNKTLDNVKIGLSLLNMGIPISYNDAVIAMPITLKVGPSFIFNLSKNLKNISSLDFEFKKFKHVNVNVGTELILKNLYSLRLGYGFNTDYQNLSGGLGYKFKIKNINAEANYTFVSLENKKLTHFLGIEMAFGQKDMTPPHTKIDLNLEYFSPNYDGKADYLVIQPDIKDNKLLKSWEVKIVDRNNNTLKSYQSPDMDTLKGKLTFKKVFTRLFEKEKEAPVPTEITWDGIDMNGKEVPDGQYKVILIAKDEKENESQPIEKTFRIKRAPPEIKIVSDYKIFSPNGDGVKDSIPFKLTLKTEPEDSWSAKIYNSENQVVREYKWKGDQIQKIDWDGKDNQNALLPDGNYDLKIEGVDLAQNATKDEIKGITLTTAKQSLAVSASLDEFSPNNDTIMDSVKFDLYASDTAGLEKWKLTILNDSGEEVKSFDGNNKLPQNIEWNGVDKNNKGLNDGLYLYKLQAWYNSGNQPESFLKKIKINNTPPAVNWSTEPDIFSPDGDGINETLSLKLNVKSASEIDTWSLIIYENNEKNLFKKFEQTGMPAQEIKWNGLSDDGRLVQSKNNYFANFEITDKVGNKTSIKNKEIKISKELPDINFDYEPQLFSPDDDGDNDLLTIKLFSYNSKKIKNWKFNIYPIRSNKRESLFIQYTGDALPKVPIIWDGKNRTGELVESAMDYDLEFVVEDILGNVKTVTKTLNVDILVIKTPYGLKIKISNIEFEFNKADLVGNAFKILDNVMKKIKKYPTYSIIIEGHTDSIGGPEYNLKLSEKRADSVYNYMVDNGVNASQLTKKGIGLSRPVAPNTNPDGSDNPEGRAKNRRVEFLLVKPGAKVTP